MAAPSASCRRPASCSCRTPSRARTCPPASSSRARRRGRWPPGPTRWPTAGSRRAWRRADRRMAGGRRAAAARAATGAPGGAGGPRPAALPDHDHRLAAADRRGPAPARAAGQGRDRRGRLRAGHRTAHHRRHRLAGADGPGRAGPRRVRANRHGRVLRRADGRLPDHGQRLGALLRKPMHAAADPGRAAHHLASR